MRSMHYLLISLLSGLLSCVDPGNIDMPGTVDVLVVDGTLTNLAEPQIIRLNRSRADRITGRFGTLPITNASVVVVVDSAESIACTEIEPGTYKLSDSFRGQINHAYQLRFTLPDGTLYQSTQQRMTAVPAIDQLTVRFNASSLPVGLYQAGFRAGYDLFISTQDPANQRNYYRWDWRLYEKQKWCHSCYRQIYIDSTQDNYVQNGLFTSVRRAIEDCVDPAEKPNGDVWNSYVCRTPCWDILYNYTLTLFDDQLTNGGDINGYPVGKVPLFTRQPALLDLRQSSLTADAYRYVQLFRQQTQNAGGIADSPPTALVGNVRNLSNAQEAVVGYFTVSAVASHRYWLDKKDATTLPMGSYDDAGQIVQFDDELYYVQNRRIPMPGPDGPPFLPGGPNRYITAPCIDSDTRTSVKPQGWRN